MQSRPSSRSLSPRLVTLGDLVLDIVVGAAAPIQRGTDVAGTIRFRAGGSAANTARAFAALGGAASFIGAIGRDGLGRRLIAALRADDVKVHAVRTAEPTARLIAVLARGGERSFITERGAADALRPTDISAAWLRRAGALHLPIYSLLAAPLRDAAARAADLARAEGALVSVDLASRRPLLDHGRATVRRRIERLAPDVVFGNVAEATALAGSRSVRPLLALAPVVVIKEGIAGCRVLWRADAGAADSDVLELDVATRRLDVTDTTGAGDAFDAGFLHALLGARPADGRPRAADLRRAALAGHRAAGRLLGRPRPELAL
ncbi:MAG TPA: PfkB family carbohydrate kinase [Candidatus Limnocylindria bacterium]|nr:PfkB family carbohydrate kinase [Candidatus Limnocylindria bacterium]